jgi:O-antigen/teichoic acid export membrane protein
MDGPERTPRRGGMLRNLIHLGLGQGATTVLTILLGAALARMLGPSDFGELFLLTSIATFAFVIVDWGYGTYIVRETARNPARAGELLGTALAVRAATAVVVAVMAVLTTWALGYDMRTRLLTGMLILGWLPQYLGLSFGWVFRAIERMDRDAILNVMLKLATLVGSFICLQLGGRLMALIVVWTVAGSLTLVLALMMYRRSRLPGIVMTIPTARELLRGGASMFVITLAVGVEPYLNANILYKMAPHTVVGWYGAAWNIAGTLLAPATIIGAAMYPRLSMAAGNAGEFKRAFEVSFRPLLLLAVLGAVGTYLFADVAVGLIYGLRGFRPSTDILRAFAPVLLLMYVDVFLGMAIFAAGKAGRLASVKLIAVVLTVGLVLALVPLCQRRFDNGGLGVMYAMAFGEVLMLLAAGSLIRETVDRRTIADVGRSVAAGAATLLLMKALPAFTPLLAIPACVLSFGGLSYLLGAVRISDIEMVSAAFRRRAAT